MFEPLEEYHELGKLEIAIAGDDDTGYLLVLLFRHSVLADSRKFGEVEKLYFQPRLGDVTAERPRYTGYARSLADKAAFEALAIAALIVGAKKAEQILPRLVDCQYLPLPAWWRWLLQTLQLAPVWSWN